MLKRQSEVMHEEAMGQMAIVLAMVEKLQILAGGGAVPCIGGCPEGEKRISRSSIADS